METIKLKNYCGRKKDNEFIHYTTKKISNRKFRKTETKTKLQIKSKQESMEISGTPISLIQ
jgi:hypothetical protein